MVEAKWLEGVASDERTMATQLSNLPSAYSILHDLKVPGSKGNIDHVIIGPGGAFLIVTRRHTEALSFHDGQLWAGDTALKGELDAARMEAQMLTQSLGTPVVPVIGILGSGVPATAPQALDGVLIAGADNVARVVSRASHTLLPATKVAELAERVLPLLNSPGTSPRVTGQVPAARAQRIEAPVSSIPPPPPPPVFIAEAPASARVERKSAKAEQSSAASAKRQARRRGSESSASDRPKKERTGWARSVGFVAASLMSLCLVAFAAGSLVRVLWPDDQGATAAASSTLPGDSTTSLFITTTSAPGLSAPAIEFTSVCNAVGAGWQLVPTWPGDVAGLAQYVVEAQNLDGSWVQMSAFSTTDTSVGALVQQGPSVSWNLRIVALLADGTRSPASSLVVTTPANSC